MNTLNYNELIYLFMDGEANAAKKETLFSAMSNNSELQKDFQMAMEMKNSISAYVAKSEVPFHLTARVLETKCLFII